MYDLSMEHFWAFARWKFWDVGHIAEPSDAEDKKIHLANLNAILGEKLMATNYNLLGLLEKHTSACT